MAWGKPPGEDVQPPENVAEDRIREIVREELLNIITERTTAAANAAVKRLTQSEAT